MPDLDYGYNVSIDKNATSDPSHVPTNQWQKKNSGGSWVNISGETGSTYEVKIEDKAAKLRLAQDLGGTKAYSNELQVTSADPPPLSTGYIAVHLKNTYQLRVYYDCMTPIDVYTKTNESDPWEFYEQVSAGNNFYWYEAIPGYYAFDSRNITRFSFGRRQNGGTGTHAFCEFELLEGSDFSNVTDMSFLFNGCKRWNQASLDWLDLSGVTDLSYAFMNTERFTGTVGFDTPDVTNFEGCWEQLNPSSDQGVNPDLSTWDTSKARKMSRMFRGRPAFNNNSITGWDTSNVNNMDGMFMDATTFNQDLTGWCVEKIPSEPSGYMANFAENSALSNSNKPNWGAPC